MLKELFLFLTEKTKSQKKKSGGGKKKSAPEANITKKLEETHISEESVPDKGKYDI